MLMVNRTVAFRSVVSVVRIFMQQRGRCAVRGRSLDAGL
jgi:hypothetical protein